VRNTAKIKASAVSAALPPDNSDSVAGFLPAVSHDLETGFERVLALDQLQFAVPPPNNSVNSFLKFSFTIWNEVSSRSRAS